MMQPVRAEIGSDACAPGTSWRDAAPRRRDAWRSTGLPPRLINAGLIVAGLGVLALVLLAHGAVPGQIGATDDAFLTQGAILCEHQLGMDALTSSCHAFGEPLGYPLLTNGPTIAIGTIAMRLGASLNGAYLIASAVIDIVALAGGYALGRRLGVRRPVALWAAALYLLAPTTLGLIGFPGTGAGFDLLPCYALADLIVLERLERRRSRVLVAVVAAYVAVRVLALFMDGYSFVASIVVSLSLWLFYRRDLKSKRRWLELAVILAANGIAVLLYKLYQGGSYPLSPLPVFRTMGLDIHTLVAPTQVQWIPAALGWTSDPTRLWGDGSNSAYNYVSIACVALAIYGVRSRFGPALLCAGVIALVVALGPALKVDDVRPAGSMVANSAYAMPARAATFELPWGNLFTKIPGLNETRAPYRWFGVTRLMVLMLAALGVERGLRRDRPRLLVLALAVLATLELLPNLPALGRIYRAQNRVVRTLTDSVGQELRGLTHPGELAFFLNVDPAQDDFLVNYLAPYAGLRTFNAGGDKNVYLAMQHWPPQITALATSPVTPTAVETALADRQVNVILAPLFDLHTAVFSWPPTAAERAQALRSYRAIFNDPRLTVQRRRWMVSIRLRGSA
jgi:hypothetical protein